MPNRLPALLCALLLLQAGCGRDDAAEDDLGIDGGAGPRDATPFFAPEDFADDRDFGPPCEPCPCGEPDCVEQFVGPAQSRFSLQSDPNPDPLRRDEGVVRDGNGWLAIESPQIIRRLLWVPNTGDFSGAGTISKFDTQGVREVARYLTITCHSLPTGSTQPCDGARGCCSLDDEDRYQARRAGKMEPGHQGVQRTGLRPSRTSVDWNGDVVVVNEAPGGQSSVSRITEDPASCIDRNGNGRIDTSNDTNGDGRIDADCNGDGQPDDVASVMGKPCNNGLRQEFYGLDDECVLWTANVFPSGASARAVTVAPTPLGGTDVWVGAHGSGAFRLLGGARRQFIDEAQLPGDCAAGGNGPGGMVLDPSGIAWVAPSSSGPLCYFDTKLPVNVGKARDPHWGTPQFDGITLDRAQTVWLGGELSRYYPNRSAGFAKLGSGWWTRVGRLAVTRPVADSRGPILYFVWACGQSGVVQVPASKLPLPQDSQDLIDPGWPVVKMPCRAVAVDLQQNVWGVSDALATRATINNVGTITQPVVQGMPMGGKACPAGDSCPVIQADAYSDMASHLDPYLRNPEGTYSLLVAGCRDAQGNPAATRWLSVDWDADVPPNTTLTVRARTSQVSAFDDPAWGRAVPTMDAAVSPLLLTKALTPNWATGLPTDTQNGWLLVDVTLKRSVANASPKLKSLRVLHRCPP